MDGRDHGVDRVSAAFVPDEEAVIQVRYGLVSTELHRRPDRSLENEGNQYLVNGIGA